jgi:hypothetical protein
MHVIALALVMHCINLISDNDIVHRIYTNKNARSERPELGKAKKPAQ